MIDFDYLPYFGSDISKDIDYDLTRGLVQPQGVLYYNRGDGANVSEYENAPLSLSTEINIRYNIMRQIVRYNEAYYGLADDRRVVSSWEVIEVSRVNDGIDVNVNYFPLNLGIETNRNIVVNL